MPDWRRYVRERLSLPRLRPEREAEIREDLAQQLDDAYRAALGRGAPADEAEAAAGREIQDWEGLARDITRSETRHHLSPAQRALERLEAGAALPDRSEAIPPVKSRRSPTVQVLRFATECTAD